MFEKTLEQIFTLKALKNAFGEISSRAVGLDGVSLEVFKEDLIENLKELQTELLRSRYTPEPLKHIHIEKEDNTERPIGLSSLRDKIVQKTLALVLSDYYEPHFSDKNYGFRRNKDTLKAVARAKDLVQKGRIWVLRTDIDNFFENIDHERLMHILTSRIEDKNVVQLIAGFLTNGSFARYRYLNNKEGIHQGDPLSPLLSNIYLNQLDWFLEEQNVAFVRYVDDISIFCHSKKEAEQAQVNLEAYLHSIDLHTTESKTAITHSIKEGFTFLGIGFKGWELSIAKDRLDQSIAKFHRTASQTKPFDDMLVKLNQHIQGLSNYQLKVIGVEHPQMKLLKEAMLLALYERVYKEKKRGTVKTKGAFRKKLMLLDFPFSFSKVEKKDYIERIIVKAFEKHLANKTYTKAETKSKGKKREYAKKYATASVLHISEPGLYIGMSKNTITLKKKGKVIHQMPKTQCERIIIASKGVSLSSNVVELCSSLGIGIDFISPGYKIETPYASLFGNNNSYAKMTLLQLKILDTPLQMKFARAFIKGKSKNQLNYLKNLDRHHALLEKEIGKMEYGIKTIIKKAKTPNELMGYEGQLAHLYWQALVKLLDSKVDFDGRVTRGADDLVNASLNYGYAILYGRVHHHAVRAGLSLNISFLHALDQSKPTLVFDLIEEFRAFVVDRTIVSMVNNNEPLKLDKDKRLDRKSRQLIAKNVLEKIGSFTKHKKASKKVDTIIAEQAYMLARAVRGLTSYKPFIGKY
ncbi:CRISPR-associated endonuclease Cas1 [Sulfurovum sp.]|uniref:CRISPR-associated endonuclease Cas1 n=1 Tax=Sulfurovum sp. TaxID=1969726 RepID=UPI0025D8D48C|nr:CRISPR-associated endonuclease Cas1 [Sulfurovum sp.]